MLYFPIIHIDTLGVKNYQIEIENSTTSQKSYIQEIMDDDTPWNTNIIRLNNLDKYMINVFIDGKISQTEVDTGAALPSSSKIQSRQNILKTAVTLLTDMGENTIIKYSTVNYT